MMQKYPFSSNNHKGVFFMVFLLVIILSQLIDHQKINHYKILQELSLIYMNQTMQVIALNNFVHQIMVNLNKLHTSEPPMAHFDVKLEQIQRIWDPEGLFKYELKNSKLEQIQRIWDPEGLFKYELKNSKFTKTGELNHIIIWTSDRTNINDYAAPEMYSENTPDDFDAIKVDLFAFGVIIHKILQIIAGIGYQTNKGYLKCTEIPNTLQNKKKRPIKVYKSSPLNPFGRLKSIASQLTHCDPSARPSVKSFLIKHEIDQIIKKEPKLFIPKKNEVSLLHLALMNNNLHRK
eukprot:NODE_269_length_11261_cov_0.600359.p7 type:complete len:291 gc:universal NODE_269_length_11261_cov_0.600359:9225-10097(+)